MVLQVLSSDASYDVLLPIALRYFSSGPAVLRPPAADAIVALMRAVQKPYQRTEILCRLLREYAQGRSCYKRLAFLDAAAAMLQRYSVRYKILRLYTHGMLSSPWSLVLMEAVQSHISRQGSCAACLKCMQTAIPATKLGIPECSCRHASDIQRKVLGRPLCLASSVQYVLISEKLTIR